jgi:group I intron endonuclease
MIGIYKITSPSKKIYIGQSIDIEYRFKRYKSLNSGVKKQILLYRSFIKYGVENHFFEVLCECEIFELNEKERYYQDLYSAIGSKGLNCKLTKSSDRKGEHSLETKQKISKAISNKRIGYKHSDETKRKIGLAHIGNQYHKGRKMPNKTKEALLKKNKGNTYNLGKKQTEETKLKISNALKGNKSCLGRKLSESAKNKISIANKGRKITDDTKKKLSESKSKIILNLENGVFSLGIKEASFTYQIEKSSLTKKLNGILKNKTNLIYV